MLFEKNNCMPKNSMPAGLSKAEAGGVSNAKKVHTNIMLLMFVCNHRKIEHAPEVYEGKFECYQTWFLSYSKSNFSWKLKRGDKSARTSLVHLFGFTPSTKPPFKLSRKSNRLSSSWLLCHLRIVNFLCHQTQLNTANVLFHIKWLYGSRNQMLLM